MKRTLTACCSIILCTLLLSAWQTGKNEKAQQDAGARLYAKYACKSCHGLKGAGTGDLRQAWKKYTDEQLMAYISNPKQFGNAKMPAFNGVIPEADFKVLIEYVKFLGKTNKP